jgi:hypothetical protein
METRGMLLLNNNNNKIIIMHVVEGVCVCVEDEKGEGRKCVSVCVCRCDEKMDG